MDALQPTFVLSADDALKASIPDTLAMQQKTVDALAVTGKVALPSAGGDSQPPQLQVPAASLLPQVTSPSGTILGEDPLLRYWAGTALFQEVQLLDRYLKDAALSRDFEPYLIRLQVSLMPQRRNLPYDAYTTVSFFQGDFGSPAHQLKTFVKTQDAIAAIRNANRPGISTQEFVDSIKATITKTQLQTATDAPAGYLATDGLYFALDELKQVRNADELGSSAADIINVATETSSLSAPRIIPLLVTDDLESSFESKSVDQIRQLSLALSAAIHGVGGQGNLTKLDEQLRSVLGRDFNSTFTLARMSDNTLRLRFGALQVATSQYAMIPQTHNVTLLLLVPKRFVRENSPAVVRLVSNTTLTDAVKGTDLLPWSENDIDRELRKITQDYDAPESDADSLLLAVEMNDFGKFESYAGQGRYPESLWVDLASLRRKSSYQFARVEVPKPHAAGIMPDQTAPIFDDTKTSASVTVRGQGDLDSSRVSAMIQLPASPAGDKSPPTFVVATAIKVSTDGRSIMITFPSLAASGFLPAVDKDGVTVPATPSPTRKLDVEVQILGQDGQVISQTPVSCTYVTKPVEGPAFNLVASAKIIDAAADGSGQAQFNLSNLSKIPTKGITISVEGADVDGDPTGTAVQPYPNPNSKPAISRNGTFILKFKNLSPAVNVTVSASDNDTNLSTKPIVFMVMQSGGLGTKQSGSGI